MASTLHQHTPALLGKILEKKVPGTYNGLTLVQEASQSHGQIFTKQNCLILLSAVLLLQSPGFPSAEVQVQLTSRDVPQQQIINGQTSPSEIFVRNDSSSTFTIE